MFAARRLTASVRLRCAASAPLVLLADGGPAAHARRPQVFARRTFFTAPRPSFNALAPFASEAAISTHVAHVDEVTEKAKLMLRGTRHEDGPSMVDVLRATELNADERAIFNNLAEVWNHGFHWDTLSPTGSKPSSTIEARLADTFGQLDSFKKQFELNACAVHGSGWTWLVHNSRPDLDELEFLIFNTFNGDTPATIPGCTPLLCLDVWEHAYMPDHGIDRAAYAKAFWDVVDWSVVEERLRQAPAVPASEADTEFIADDLVRSAAYETPSKASLRKLAARAGVGAEDMAKLMDAADKAGIPEEGEEVTKGASPAPKKSE